MKVRQRKKRLIHYLYMMHTHHSHTHTHTHTLGREQAGSPFFNPFQTSLYITNTFIYRPPV